MNFAHGLPGRVDLPIPAELFGAAAAAVLVVSFLALGAGWTRPRLEPSGEQLTQSRVPLAVEIVLGALGVAVFSVAIYAGLAGSDRMQDNLTPTLVYVGFWVGVPFAQLLFGDVWRLISPWRALGRAAGWLVARAGAPAEALPYPERLGQWPAAAGLVAFGIAELCWAPARDPGPLAILMLVYLAVQVLGMGVYGVEAWTRRGDAFGVWFGMLAALSPLSRRSAPGLMAVPGTVAVLIAAVGVTAFDGAREGPVFNDAAPGLQDAFVSAGLSLGAALEWTFVLGLVVTLALVAAIWWAAVAGMREPPEGLDRAGLGRRFAHSLIPIGAAYVVAHYFSLLVFNGQDLWRLASDPLGRGSDLFGGAGAGIDYGVVSATTIWYVQVAALVAGHVAALVLAHDRALVVYGDAKRATRSQIVMLAVMVVFTCLGLYLLSAANA